MAANNYRNTSSMSDEYYKVSFITTHSNQIPKKMKQTGALIIMDNVESKRKSIWFRGELIASGYGFTNEQEAGLATYFINNINEIFGGPNGVYDFVPGYIGPKGEEGKSAYQRLSDLWTSYWIDHTYFTEKIEAIEEDLENNWTYTYDAYSYTLGYIQNVYQALFAYTTSSYERSYSLSKDIWIYLLDSYAYTWSGLDAVNSYLLEYVKTSYDTGYATDQTIYNASYSYVGYMSNYLHKYVDSVVSKLIGDAPETLDTLGEIAYMLQMATSYEFRQWELLHNVAKDYVSRYPREGAYTYINHYAFALVPEEHLGFTYSEEGPNVSGDNPDLDEDGYPDFSTDGTLEGWFSEVKDGQQYWYQATYTYFTYTLEQDGFLALESDQVSCLDPFGRYQLTYLLTKILPPYKYDIPSIDLTYEQEYELNNTVREFGTSDTFTQIRAIYNAKDAGGENAGNTEIRYNNENQGELITQLSNPDNNFEFYQVNGVKSKSYKYVYPDRIVNINIGEIRYNSYPYQTLNNIIVKYPESYVRQYPEITDLGLDIPDLEHVIPGGSYSKDIFEKIKIPVRYRIYWWTDSFEVETPDLNIDLKNYKNSSDLILERQFETDTMLKGDVQNIYVAIPDALLIYLRGIKIQNYDTGISKEIYANNNPIKSDLFDIKVLKHTHETEIGIEIPYTIYKYSSLFWTLGDIFRITLDFKQLY